MSVTRFGTRSARCSHTSHNLKACISPEGGERPATMMIFCMRSFEKGFVTLVIFKLALHIDAQRKNHSSKAMVVVNGVFYTISTCALRFVRGEERVLIIIHRPTTTQEINPRATKAQKHSTHSIYQTPVLEVVALQQPHLALAACPWRSEQEEPSVECSLVPVSFPRQRLAVA